MTPPLPLATEAFALQAEDFESTLHTWGWKIGLPLLQFPVELPPSLSARVEACVEDWSKGGSMRPEQVEVVQAVSMLLIDRYTAFRREFEPAWGMMSFEQETLEGFVLWLLRSHAEWLRSVEARKERYVRIHAAATAPE